MPSSSSTPPSSPPASPSAEPEEGRSRSPRAHTTPEEHRRNRKLWRAEEREDFWRRKRAEKRQRRREAKQEVREQRRQEWESLPEEEREARRAAAAARHDAARAAAEAEHQLCERQLADPALPVLVFDMSFAWCMTPGDARSAVSQVQLSYSAVRRAHFPLRVAITSLCGASEREAATRDTAAQAPALAKLRDYAGFARYPPAIHETQHWSSLFPLERVVFLTADAPEVLDDIRGDTVYVVGAFVDHNRHKGLSYATAREYGVRTARLPIEEHVDVGNRCKVLTVNHLTQLLVEYLAGDARDWGAALEAVLPTRRVHQEAAGRERRRKRQRDADSHTGGGDSEGRDDAQPASST